MNIQLENESESPLISVDLSYVYSQLRAARKGGRAMPLREPARTRNSDQTTEGPNPSQALSLVPVCSGLVHSQATSLLPPRSLQIRPLGGQPHPVRIRPLNTIMYRVLVSSPHRGAAKDFEFEVPISLPRFINAATLKAMVGTGVHDVLLRKAGERWEICPDTFRIDLQDPSEVFRIGRVQVFS